MFIRRSDNYMYGQWGSVSFRYGDQTITRRSIDVRHCATLCTYSERCFSFFQQESTCYLISALQEWENGTCYNNVYKRTLMPDTNEQLARRKYRARNKRRASELIMFSDQQNLFICSKQCSQYLSLIIGCLSCYIMRILRLLWDYFNSLM